MNVVPEIHAVATRGKRAAQKTRTRGTAKLSKAADQQIEEKSAQIAQSLVEATLKGSVQCARLLLDLAEQQPAEAKSADAQSISNVADRLAAEPPWDKNQEKAGSSAESGVDD